jgi:hypothetical protein
MKLQKSTLILLVTALLGASFIYVYEIKGKEKSAKIAEESQKIFNFTEAEIKSLQIERKSETLIFEATKDELLPWTMIKPDQVKASEAAVSYLITPLVGGKSKGTFSINANQKADYGLDQPIAKLMITLDHGETHQLILGKTNFDEKLVYAVIDPLDLNASTLDVKLVPISLKYALERPLAEWKETDNIKN